VQIQRGRLFQYELAAIVDPVSASAPQTNGEIQ